MAIGPMSRRQFLKTTGAALGGAAVPLILPTSRAFGANDRVVIGLMGCGGRGDFLAEFLASRTDCRIAYVSDADSRRMGPVADKVARISGTAPRQLQDFRHILDIGHVDALISATPDHWHALATIWACQAGKDVYVEKPASHNIWEGRKMVEAARKYRRVVQVGAQNRSAPEVMAGVEYLRSGKLGSVHFVRVLNMKQRDPIGKKADEPVPSGVDYDLWCGPAPMKPFNPNRFHYSWHWFWDFSGGDIINDGVHQIDIARWLIDKPYPRAVSCTGGKYAYDDDQETPDTQVAHWEYDDMTLSFNLTLWTPYMQKTAWEVRDLDQFPDWRFCATRIEVYGTKGMMMMGRHGEGWQVYGIDGKVVDSHFGRHPHGPHLENFFACIRDRKTPSGDIEELHRSTFLCQTANIAYRVGGRRLEIDPEGECFIGADDANVLVKRRGRAPYQVPERV